MLVTGVSVPEVRASCVDGCRALGVRIILWRFTAIVFSVITHDPNATHTDIVPRGAAFLIGISSLAILPRNKKNEIAGRQNRIKNVPRPAHATPWVEAEPFRTVPGIVCLLPFCWTRRVDQCDCSSLSNFGLIEPLFCENLTFGQVVVGRELANAQMVVGQNGVASLLLYFVMPRLGPPTYK